MISRPLSRLVVGAATAAALALMAVPAPVPGGPARHRGPGRRRTPASAAGPPRRRRPRCRRPGHGAGRRQHRRRRGGDPRGRARARDQRSTGSASPWRSGPRPRWARWRRPPGVTRVDWADEELLGRSPRPPTQATRAIPVHDGAVDVDGDGVLDELRPGQGFSVADRRLGHRRHPPDVRRRERRLPGQEEHEGASAPTPCRSSPGASPTTASPRPATAPST